MYKVLRLDRQLYRPGNASPSSANVVLLVVRPPGTAVPDGLMLYRRCFLFFRHAFSEIPPPIELKLCHMIRIWPYFIN